MKKFFHSFWSMRQFFFENEADVEKRIRLNACKIFLFVDAFLTFFIILLQQDNFSTIFIFLFDILKIVWDIYFEIPSFLFSSRKISFLFDLFWFLRFGEFLFWIIHFFKFLFTADFLFLSTASANIISSIFLCYYALRILKTNNENQMNENKIENMI